MPLQDLTPQLRTRLSRLERWVGIFVSVATLLVLVGLVFYIRQMARDKGWYKRKLPYFTFVDNAAGLKVGDKVKMMGFEIGEITEVRPQPPEDALYNVYVAFFVMEPNDGYLWDDSRAKVGAGDFPLGNRAIEVTKGTNGAPSYILNEVRELRVAEAQEHAGSGTLFIGQDVFDASGRNRLARPGQPVTKELLHRFEGGGVDTFQVLDKSVHLRYPKYIWDYKTGRYTNFNRKDPMTGKGYFLPPHESPALTERLDQVIDQVQTAIPNFLALTNRLNEALEQAVRATADADQVLADTRPLVANLTRISANLTNAHGSLGEWLLPNFNTQVTSTLTNARTTLASANRMLTNSDARVAELATTLDRALEELAGITSNFHRQVDANTNILSNLSKLVVDTDNMIQGLKRHWLLRSAFKEPKTNAPPTSTSRKAVSPKDAGR